MSEWAPLLATCEEDWKISTDFVYDGPWSAKGKRAIDALLDRCMFRVSKDEKHEKMCKNIVTVRGIPKNSPLIHASSLSLSWPLFLSLISFRL